MKYLFLFFMFFSFSTVSYGEVTNNNDDANSDWSPAKKRKKNVAKKIKKKSVAKKRGTANKLSSKGGGVVKAIVSRSRQTMTVSVNGKQIGVWKASTGKAGHATKAGTHTPFEFDNYSQEFKAALPHGVKFYGGQVVHGTVKGVGKLGTAASHGCVRLSVANARTFESLVKRHGLRNTRIIVQ